MYLNMYKCEQIIQDKYDKDQIFNLKIKFWRYYKIHNKSITIFKLFQISEQMDREKVYKVYGRKSICI